MVSVFISHASEDTEFSIRLTRDLNYQNFDARTIRDIIPSDIKLSKTRLDRRVTEAISTNTYFVPVLTPISIESHWVKKEIHAALATEKKTNEYISNTRFGEGVCVT